MATLVINYYNEDQIGQIVDAIVESDKTDEVMKREAARIEQEYFSVPQLQIVEG